MKRKKWTPEEWRAWRAAREARLLELRTRWRKTAILDLRKLGIDV